VTTVDAQALLTISEVSARSGFAASALRFYEDEGLIVATRTAGGQRRYQRSVLRRLAFIRAAGNVGLTLEDIRAELGRLPGNRTPTKTDWARITRHWRGRLDEQIAGLERLRDGLESCIGCGCLSLKQCSISNPADVEGDGNRRSGARLLPRALRARDAGDLSTRVAAR
jgi:MerR family redox-sensitive transcriptional activator SoxR